MKKILLAAVFLTGFSFGFAQQALDKKLDPKEDKDLMTWYHKDFATTKYMESIPKMHINS